MENLQTYHDFVIATLLVFFLIPAGRILYRSGHSPLWLIFTFVPFFNIILFWVFAFKPWPKIDRLKEAP